MILRLIPFAVLVIAVWSYALPEPYVIESKVQQDLENTLSRIISRDQFLVQSTADIQIDVERKLVEGESIQNAIPKDPEEEPPTSMPGFVPEPVTKDPKFPQQIRQIYKNVDVPTLKSLSVHVNFDDKLALAIVTRGRNLVETYLATNYKGKARATYGQMPMLNPDKKREIANEQEALLKKIQDWDKNREKKEPTLEELAWKYARWSALVFLLLIILTLFLKPQLNKSVHQYSGKTIHSSKGSNSAGASGGDYAGRPYQEGGAFVRAMGQDSVEGYEVVGGRRQLLDRFLIRSEVFRSYYENLDLEQRKDLYSALRGPGYERLLDGLGYPIPADAKQEAPNVEELLTSHFKNFDELVKASDWKDRQYFGFVQNLSDGQMRSLLNHVNARGIAMLLRFLKPKQSALALDALPPARRLEVLATIQTIKSAPIQEIQRVEKEVREIVSQIPNQYYGSKKEDVDFWGSVISESEHQEELLNDLEKTNPEIYPTLKKFRFSLEDAATLPNNLLQKVLGDCDNNELGQALATCSPDVAEVLLDAVSEKRRQVLESQIATYRRIPKESLRSARLNLTRRLREVMT